MKLRETAEKSLRETAKTFQKIAGITENEAFSENKSLKI